MLRKKLIITVLVMSLFLIGCSQQSVGDVAPDMNFASFSKEDGDTLELISVMYNDDDEIKKITSTFTNQSEDIQTQSMDDKDVLLGLAFQKAMLASSFGGQEDTSMLTNEDVTVDELKEYLSKTDVAPGVNLVLDIANGVFNQTLNLDFDKLDDLALQNFNLGDPNQPLTFSSYSQHLQSQGYK